MTRADLNQWYQYCFVSEAVWRAVGSLVSSQGGVGGGGGAAVSSPTLHKVLCGFSE